MQLSEDQMLRIGPLLDPQTYRSDAPLTLLVARMRNAIGDWVLTLSMIKIVNQQFPNIRVDVDMANAPSGWADMLATWDVVAAPVTNPDPYDYDYYTGHLLYPILDDGALHVEDVEYGGAHLITGMCRTLKLRTGLPLKYPGETRARYIGPGIEELLPELALPDEFIAMVSVGRPNNRDSVHKEWPIAYLHAISNAARQRYSLVQLALPGHPKLQSADRVLDKLTLIQLCAVLGQAKLVIALENGISHIAGHTGAHCSTLYREGARAQPMHVGYPKQYQIILSECDALTVSPEAKSDCVNKAKHLISNVIAPRRGPKIWEVGHNAI